MAVSGMNRINLNHVKLLAKYLKPVDCFKTSFVHQMERPISTLYLRRQRCISFFGYQSHRFKTVAIQNEYILDLEQFNSVSRIIHDDLVECEDDNLKEAMNWFSNVFQYNLKNGKKNRGTAVLKAYKTLSNNATSDGLLSASILGWCIELMQGFFLVTDDVMDQSSTRRGQPCWYKNPDVGLIAINDAQMLHSGVYKILKRHFENSSFYLNVVQEFLQVSEKTIYGQCLDMLNNPLDRKPDYKKFTFDKYKAIVEYKTAHYTYCLPVHLAMHLVGSRPDEEFEITRQICLKIGLLFQIQDDYLDCYGDPKLTGKLGTDIMRGKCSWFAVTFLESSNDSLKKEWMVNYGKPDEESVSKIMLLYDTLNLIEKYLEFENSLYEEIKSQITKDIKDPSMQSVFFYLLQKTYKRQK